MGYKQKGYTPFTITNKQSPFTKASGKSFWSKAKDWAKDKAQAFRDAAVNMDNIGGIDKKTKAIRKADLTKQNKILKEQKARNEQADKDRKTKTDAYWAYKEEHGKGAEHHKAATEAGEKAVKESHAKRKADLASHSPKTEKESKKQGLLLKYIIASAEDKKKKKT